MFKNENNILLQIEKTYTKMSIVGLRKELKFLIKQSTRNPTEINIKKCKILRKVMYEKHKAL